MRNPVERPALRNRTVTMTLTLPELHRIDEALTEEAGRSYNWYDTQEISELRSRVRDGIAAILAHA